MKDEDDHEFENPDQSDAEDEQGDRIIRLPELLRTTGECRSSVYVKMGAGRFPRKRKIGRRSVGWSFREVQADVRITLAGGEYRTPVDQQ